MSFGGWMWQVKLETGFLGVLGLRQSSFVAMALVFTG